MKPYYQDDSATIYHGDCRDVLPWLGPTDLVVTDPPYGVGKADWDDSVPPWLSTVLDTGAPIAVVMASLKNLMDYPPAMGSLQYRWTLAAHLVNGMTVGSIGFGNWIPCLVYARAEVSVFRQDQDCRSFVVGREPRPDHPSPKPANVTGWVIGLMGGAVVVDPFMGSGTTLRAAKDLGRKSIGIEIEERYCEIAAKRLAQEVLDFGAA